MKQTAKQKKTAAEKAALRRRVMDILQGAYGGYDIREDDLEVGIFGMLGAEGIELFTGAIEQTFLMAEGLAWMRGVNSLSHYEDVDKLVDWLHDNGVRA